MKIQKITYFHPSGKTLPNGSHFQRGGFLHDCRLNKEAFTLAFPHLEGPCGLGCQGGVIIFPTNTEVVDFPLEIPQAHYLVNHSISDLLIGHIFQGMYVDSDGNVYNKESLTVEVDGEFFESVFGLAQELAQMIYLKNVIVKDLSENEIYILSL